ncbi:adenosylhomocysteinase [Candidatus Microgenomates bacterium]|nr:adenosylhomocysteinase [Candidatus Microgenomates bacterium]
MKYDVKDLSLSSQGKLKIEWAGQQMAVLRLIELRFKKEKSLKNLIIGACLHVTSETANLMLALKAGGAKPYLCASNPLSTQDDVAASLVKDFKIPVFAKKGENNNTYYQHLRAVLDVYPQITMDDGADLVSELHKNRQNQIKNIFGSSEETTTGVIRLRAMAKDKALKLPVIAVNDSQTKYLFDNRYGTGQSTIDGILRATNTLLAGKSFVVIGYGWCGRGIAMRAKGMGANVIICEVNSIRALEALMDGFRVMKLSQAVKIGDIFVTSTGDKKVIDKKHLEKMKSGAILANAGHFNVEINLEALERMTRKKRRMRPFLDEYYLKDDRKIYVLGEGRLVNLAAAEGHPASVMDMSFANQALAAEFFVKNKGRLKNKVYSLPKKLDKQVAKLKLESMGVKIDRLTREQKKYLSSWREGT